MSKWPLVPLREVLALRKETIQIDDLQTYKRCRVRLHAQGIVLRDQVPGTEIKTKTQQVCQAGEFLVAEIDAKVGGFGIVPEALAGAVVSSHYFLYQIDWSKLDRAFLGFFIQTPAFLAQVAAQGSTNYAAIRSSDVLQYVMPLPPIHEQRRVVEKIKALAVRIEEARRLRAEAEEEGGALIFAETTRVFDGLKGYLQHPIGGLGPNGTNPVQTGPFGAQLHAFEFVENGVPVLNVGNVWPEGLDLGHLDRVTQEKACVLARYSLKTADILFARSGATLGKVCLVPRQSEGWLMSGHLFRVRLDKERCEPKFVLAGLRGARSIRDQVFGQVRGATRPGFNTTLLSRVVVPLPPMEKQREVVEQLEHLHGRVKSLLTAAQRTKLDSKHYLGFSAERSTRKFSSLRSCL